MKKHLGTHLPKSDWPLILVSISVLMVYLYYAVSFVFLAPYAGIGFVNVPGGWRVLDSVQSQLGIGDVITQIDSLSYQEFRANRLRVPFEGLGPGDQVTLRLEPDDRVVELELQAPTIEDRLRRLLPTLSFFPFWIAGSAVLLFLQPRDRRWRLLVTFLYLTAVWVVVGTISSWRIGASRPVLGACCWLMVPVVIDLHLTVPTPRFQNLASYLLPPLYGIAIALAVLEFFQVPPQNAPLIGLLLALMASLALLVYRFADKSTSPSERISTRLILTGVAMAFGPGILEVLLSQIREPPVSGILGNSIALIAIPILPLFYIYAIYKRQLGALEFRANRLLSVYSFILLYPPAFLLFLLIGERWIHSAGSRTIYFLAFSIAFVLATPPLLSRFQNWINRLAYGTEHNPDDIIRVFANQIPSVLKREALVQLLTEEVAPSMLIRQSALYLFEDDGIIVLYADGVSREAGPHTRRQVQKSLVEAARYRPPLNEAEDELDWVRLAVPLQARDETIGIWLFGRRDPDDFYPQNDVELLRTLANQIAPVIENIRLYEALQWQADHLAEEVTKRTAELRAERDRTQAILDSAGEGIFFTDPDGVIQYVNLAMTTLSGQPAEHALGQPLDFWRSISVNSSTHEQMWAAIDRGEGWSGELVHQRSDGSTYDVRLTLAPIRSEEGHLAGYVGVESDISKLKEVDRLKSNILSNVSHELKTPLTNIKMYLTLLDRGKTEKWYDYLTVLNRESDRLTHLIQDLLDLSRLDTGTVRTLLEPTDLRSLVSKVVESCSQLAQNKAITLATDMPPSLPTAHVDCGQIEQVLTNLVVNAVNYTLPEGRVTVTAGEAELEERPALWFRVSDTGPGIAADDLPHLFDRFYRGRVGEESGVPGTGLGLAICREIMERHHGRIDIESEPGVGSTFTCWLATLDGQES